MSLQLSIITINYNNVQGLNKTISSVLEQTYSNIEYIVIDGSSTDGSKEYIESVQQYLNYWVSEPDEGIYHAMNKGIFQANGDYLLFLNSGDWLVNDLVIEKFIEFNPVEDILYGDVILLYQDNKKQYKKMPRILEGLAVLQNTITHQSMFIKKKLFADGGYDLRYSIIADWVFYNSAILLKKCTYRYLDFLISNYDMSGTSSDPNSKNQIKREREKFYVQHAAYFVPKLIERYEITVRKFQNNQKPLIVKMAIKIAKKLNLINHI